MKHLRISRHGKVRAGALDDDNDDYKLSPSADEDEFDATGGPGARFPAAASAARRQVPSAAEASWRVGGGRRKRLSLPSIRLYSSLDSPGACYGDQPPQPGAKPATTVAEDQAKNNAGKVPRNRSRKNPASVTT